MLLPQESMQNYTLALAIGAPVVLLGNIDVPRKLYNGAEGHVVALAPDRITVHFTDAGQTCDILRSNHYLPFRGVTVHAKQFPLLCTFAKTVHRVQVSLGRRLPRNHVRQHTCGG